MGADTDEAHDVRLGEAIAESQRQERADLDADLWRQSAADERVVAALAHRGDE